MTRQQPAAWGFCLTGVCAWLQGGFLLTLGLPEGDRNFDDKADVLEINGFAEEWQFALRAGTPPETGLLAFLRLMNCGGAPRMLRHAHADTSHARWAMT